MTKSELMVRLAEVFAEKNGNQLVAKDIEYSVKVLVDTMTRSLAKGQRIEIRGFGSFDLNHRPARIGRNPKTGEKVDVPENMCRISSRVKNCASAWIRPCQQTTSNPEAKKRRSNAALLYARRFDLLNRYALF
jgi:integration host factor subunit beta